MTPTPEMALFDYGAGNLHSLAKAVEAAGARVRVTDSWGRALAADALVLPGVGAFAAAVDALPPDPARVREALEAGLPCLGVCLGMQLLFDSSEEGEGAGIGLIPGQVRRLETAVVPQMGWNDVDTTDDPLFEGVGPFVAYYANSFVCEPAPAAPAGVGPTGAAAADRASPGPAIAWSEAEGRTFVAAVRRGRTWGVQFHPEKSSTPGLRLISNFVAEVAR